MWFIRLESTNRSESYKLEPRADPGVGEESASAVVL